MPELDFYRVLRALHDGGVEFLVVGGVAAVLQGAPVNTFDVDVVFSRSEANVARLLPVLHALDAHYRIQPERRLVPTASHLASPGHQNLITPYGAFDLLGTVGHDLGYEDLLPQSVQMDIGEGIQVRVLKLEKLIEIKEELGQEKDLATLPVLRRTVEARNKT
jgi:predicted nucleotidyltransferase